MIHEDLYLFYTLRNSYENLGIYYLLRYTQGYLWERQKKSPPSDRLFRATGFEEFLQYMFSRIKSVVTEA